MTAPDDGATYVEGELTPSYDCTDRGGSSLRSCTASPGQPGAPGAHTMTVTAVDGAGLTATQTRHYTVLAASRPDAMARRKGTKRFTGDDLYDRAHQRVLSKVPARGSAKLLVRVQNDGARPDTLSWAVDGGGRFRIRGKHRGTTPLLQPGEVWTFRLSAHRTAQNATRPKARARLRVTSTVTGRADTLLWLLRAS